MPSLDLLRTDGVGLEGVAQEDQPVFEAERARRGNPLHEEVPGILDRRQDARVPTRGGLIGRRGCVALKTLVGPLLVVEAAEGGEGAVLGGEGGARGANGL